VNDDPEMSVVARDACKVRFEGLEASANKIHRWRNAIRCSVSSFDSEETGRLASRWIIIARDSVTRASASRAKIVQIRRCSSSSSRRPAALSQVRPRHRRILLAENNLRLGVVLSDFDVALDIWPPRERDSSGANPRDRCAKRIFGLSE